MSAPTGQAQAKQVNPLQQLNPTNAEQSQQSSSSLMEASCESEVLELELNSKLENSRLDIDNSSPDVSVSLVSASDDPSKCEQSRVDTSPVEVNSTIKFEVKNIVEEDEANTISTSAQGNFLTTYIIAFLHHFIARG